MNAASSRTLLESERYPKEHLRPGAEIEVRTRANPQVPTGFRVTDSNGRILRSEELPAATDLADRLRLTHRNYQLQGWTVDPLLPGRWSFMAEKAGQRILIGIRPPPADVPRVVTHPQTQHPTPTATARRHA